MKTKSKVMIGIAAFLATAIGVVFYKTVIGSNPKLKTTKSTRPTFNRRPRPIQRRANTQSAR